MVAAENTVVGIYGWKGAGKTITLTLMLLLESLDKKKPVVYSNYSLGFPFKWLKGEDVVEMASHLQNSAIGIDELHEYADCRNSGTLQNKRVADFFLQSRHTNSNVYYTTQYKDQVDKRIRRITDIDIICENMMEDSDNDGYDDIFRMTLKDRRKFDTSPVVRLFYAAPIWDLYDSTERINPFTYKTQKVKKI